MSPRVLDLFCGCGGMSTGFKRAGFDIACAVDIWNKATDTYSANHEGTRVVTADITTLSVTDLVESRIDHVESRIDLVIGGPPCQGFSRAGRRDPSDPRNSLFVEFLRLVKESQPRFVVMENVPGILTMKTSEGNLVKDIILEEYRSAGYHVTYQVMNAADYGVPQARKRVFFIAKRSDQNIEITFPLPLSKHIAVETALIPRPNVPAKAFLSQRAIAGIERKKQESKAKGHGFGAQFLDLTKPSYTITARYWKDGYDALVRYDDQNIRRLLPQELAKIQTFPTNYVFRGSQKDIITQIGNAVPCTLAYHIAKHIMDNYFVK